MKQLYVLLFLFGLNTFLFAQIPTGTQGISGGLSFGVFKEGGQDEPSFNRLTRLSISPSYQFFFAENKSVSVSVGYNYSGRYWEREQPEPTFESSWYHFGTLGLGYNQYINLSPRFMLVPFGRVNSSVRFAYGNKLNGETYPASEPDLQLSSISVAAGLGIAFQPHENWILRMGLGSVSTGIVDDGRFRFEPQLNLNGFGRSIGVTYLLNR